MASVVSTEQPKSPKPFKIVSYPIGIEPNGAALHLYGNPEASRVVLMCGGYPDDHDGFAPLASQLTTKMDCLVGIACEPGFDDREDFPYTNHKIKGYTFDEMTSALKEAARVLRKESTCKEKAELTGIFHDWGCVVGLKYYNACSEEGVFSEDILPKKLVLFDIIGRPHRESKDRGKIGKLPRDSLTDIIYLTYMPLFAVAFFIRLKVSSILAQAVRSIGMRIMETLSFCPLYGFESSLMTREIPMDRTVYMGYPYYNMFKLALAGRMKDFMSGFTLPQNLMKTPVLYMYGTTKRVMGPLHDKRGVALMELEEAKDGSKSRSIGVKDAGHWLFLQQPELCSDEVVKFVTDS